MVIHNVRIAWQNIFVTKKEKQKHCRKVTKRSIINGDIRDDWEEGNWKSGVEEPAKSSAVLAPHCD